MPYTEMENITLTKLALISQRARMEPKFQFTSLAHLLNEEFLKECYYRLGRDQASGIDGVSWKEYGEHLDENLENLVARMRAKRYKPLPAKRVYIPKNEHEKRPLGLPALEDKIVQKGITQRYLPSQARLSARVHGAGILAMMWPSVGSILNISDLHESHRQPGSRPGPP